MPPLSVLDACVLIDFCLEDANLLSLAAGHLGTFVVLTPVLAEVRQLDEAECARLGIETREPDLELAISAADKRGGLSYNDRLSLAYARQESCTLYTNDKALLTAAESDGVDARWGLQILIDLANGEVLTPHQATTAAQNICNRSHFPTARLMEEFRSKLR